MCQYNVMTYRAPVVLKSDIAKCQCWNLKYIFCLKSITFTMTLSISTCKKLKFIHGTRSFVTQSQRGLFKNFSIEQDAQHVTGSIFCRVLWPLTPFIFQIKSKSAQHALKFDVHSFCRIQIIKICTNLQWTEISHLYMTVQYQEATSITHCFRLS